MSEVSVPGTSHATLSSGCAAWLSKYTIPPGSREKVETHMSLAGGPYSRLSIPDEMHESWLRVYAAELALDTHSLFFAERRTPIFRMHFDLDFTEVDPVSLHFLMTMSRGFVRVFRTFFPLVPEDAVMWRCAILTATPKPIVVTPLGAESGDDGARVKSGCHMLWPWMYVTQVQSLQLRATVVDMLTRTWPARPATANTYADVVDRTVLTSNGLRMMGSDKASRCKKCNNAAGRDKCEPCAGRGVLVENRAYMLTMVLDPLGEPDRDRLTTWTGDLFLGVRFTSTRSSRQEHSSGFLLPAHAVTDDAVKKASKKAKGKPGTGTVDTRQEAAGLPGSTMFDATSRIFTELATFLTSHIQCTQWAGVRLTHLFCQREQGRYTVNVTGPGSSYCTNVNRAHGSSTIYFTVERDGVRQRCFSPKITDGVSCRSFIAPPIELSTWLIEAMFGEDKSTPVPASSDEVTLARSATLCMNLGAKNAATRMKRDIENKITEIGGGVKRVCHSGRGENLPNGTFRDKTCGEVDNMSAMQVAAEFKAQCTARVADSARVHATEVSFGGAMAPKTAKKKRISAKPKRGVRGP